MEAVTTTAFPWSEVSIGVAVVFVLFVMVQVFKTIVTKILNQLDQNQKDYKAYVNDNNHTVTSLVKESTMAITKHTETLEQIVKRLEK